jgi:hypothetical protein
MRALFRGEPWGILEVPSLEGALKRIDDGA